ncbi:MAG: DUF2442 domain-containing protein [Nodosilinea sp.]
MADLIDDIQFLEQYQRAVEAANQVRATEPQAVSVHYDDINSLIVIRLNSGASFSFPPDIAQGLADASPEDLAAVEITPSGMGLHWENLDADFSVTGLLRGCFGTRTWMATLQNHLQSHPMRPKMPRDNKQNAMNKLWAPNPIKLQAKATGSESSSKMIE